jgi:hypothetical protein
MTQGSRLPRKSAEGRARSRERKLREKWLKIFLFDLRELLHKNELRKRHLQDFETDYHGRSPGRRLQFAASTEIDVFEKYVIERCYELSKREARFELADEDARATAPSEWKAGPEHIAYNEEHGRADLAAMERRQAVIDALLRANVPY